MNTQTQRTAVPRKTYLQRENEINELGQLLLQARDFKTFKQVLLQRLERLFDADGSLFLDWTPITYDDRRWAGDDLFLLENNEDVDRYYERFHEDPVYQWLTSPRCKKDSYVTRYSDLVNFGNFKKTRFYCDALAPLNYRHILSIAFNRGDDIIGNISLMRFNGTKNFTDADVKIGRIIAPLINGAFQNLRLREEVALRDTVFEIVESLTQNCAYVILTQGMRTIFRSPKSASVLSWLHKNRALRLQDLLLSADDLRDFLALFQSSQSAKKRRLPNEINSTINITSTKQLNITLRLFNSDSERTYLLVMMNPALRGEQQASDHTRFDLSLRELQVAQLAITGLSSQSIAKTLSISPWSVKNHLKNIYKKVGVNNRIKLSQILQTADPDNPQQ